VSTPANAVQSQTLAKLVRSKYPGAYDDMDDATLEKNVLAKYPQYSDLPRTQTAQSQVPNTMAQARQTIANIIPNEEAYRQDPRLRNVSLPPWVSPAQVASGENQYQRQSGEQIGQVAAGMATGGLLPAVKGAGLASNFLRFLGRTGISGASMGAGTLAGGGTPQEAKGAAEGGVVGQPIAEAAGATLPWMAKGLKNTAVKQYEKALAPTTKVNKAITQDIAPEMIQRGVRGSLEGMEQKAGQKISELNPQLNTAYQQAGAMPTSAGSIPGATIAGAGNKVIQDLETLKQSYMPGGNVAQPQAVNAIEGVQGIIKQYGPDVSPDNLRRLRQIFEDPVAQRGGYAGADLSTNYTLSAQKQAADSIRGILNKNPDIGSLNKELSFWLDVQRVTSESGLRRTGQEGGLLKTLWPLGAAIAGGGAGFAAHGTEAGLGAAATTMLATQVAKAARSPAWRTVSAVTKDRLANALARGDVAATSALLSKVGLSTAGSSQQTAPAGLPWQRQGQLAQPPTQ
jgi:hypothetical protein